MWARIKVGKGGTLCQAEGARAEIWSAFLIEARDRGKCQERRIERKVRPALQGFSSPAESTDLDLQAAGEL